MALTEGRLAVLLRRLPVSDQAEPRWECVASNGMRVLCTEGEVIGVSARLLDMGGIDLSDHIVTPLFARQRLPAFMPVDPFTPLPIGALVRQRPSGRLAIVHRVWRRGLTMVLEVLRADGRVETCRLEQIEGYYPVESLSHPCPSPSNSELLLGQRVTSRGTTPEPRNPHADGRVHGCVGTRSFNSTAVSSSPVRCGVYASVQTYSQAVLAAADGATARCRAQLRRIVS